MNKMYELWSKANDYLRPELSPMVYEEYIANIKPVYLSEDTYILKVDEEYKRNLIIKLYEALISKAVRYANEGKNLSVKFIVDDNEYIDIYSDSLSEGSSLQFHPHFSSKYTFDTFVVGSNNMLAHAASLAVAQAPGKKYNPLFIYGGVGLGKTHLMQAIAQYVLKEKPYANVAYVTSEKFTSDFIDAIQKETNYQFRKKYRNVDVLLIDDIQFLSGKEGTQEEFFHTFNELHNAEKQIIITSDKHPSEIPNLEQRLKTRFQWGLTCDISPPNFETRVAILKKKAEDDNFYVSDDVMDFIAEHLGNNIRELEGVLLKVKAIQDLYGEQITIESLKHHLKDSININEKHISPELIIQTVAKEYNVSFGEILSPKRTKNIALARQVAMALTREFTDLSLPNIGDTFGGRNHSTVIHAIDKINKDEANNETFKKRMNELRKALKSL